MAKGKIFIISGPSGSGKTTLYKKLLAGKKSNLKLARSISITTRPRRIGERHGRDYLFVSLKMFLHKKRSGHFLESERVFNNYYGTPLKGVRDLQKIGRNVLLCIDVKGANTVRRKIPKAISIFIKTTSLAVLEARLKARGSEKKKSMQLRLKTARKELKEARKYNYVIVNDSLGSACRHLEAIIRSEIN